MIAWNKLQINFKSLSFSILSGVAWANFGNPQLVQALTLIPSDLNPGDQYRLVFVTSTTRNALSTQISDYNAFVDATAKAEDSLLKDLDTTWNAIGSTSTVDARDNTNTNPEENIGVPIYLIDGNRVANNNADLWDGSILVQIDRTEKDNVVDRTPPFGFTNVWTGTNFEGFGRLNDELGTNTPHPVRGIANLSGISTGQSWIAGSFNIGIDSSFLFAMYGMSGTLTVPSVVAPSTPEPNGLLGLLTLGGLILAGTVSKSRK